MARSGHPVTRRSSLGRPVIVAPRSAFKIAAVALLEASQLRSGLLRACRLRLGGPAGGRVLAARSRAETPKSATPAMHRASRVTPQRLASRANRARARGCRLSSMSPAVLSVRVPTVRRIDRPAPRACPSRGLPRKGDQSDLWTTHSEHKRARNAHQPSLDEACFPVQHGATPPARIASGICVSAGADCRQ